MRIKLLILMFLLCLPSQSWAVIGFDDSTAVSSSANATTCSFAHPTTGTATLGLLWILLDADETISSATWGGSAMNFVAVNSATGGGDQRAWLYERHSPATGSPTVAAVFSQDNHHACIAMTFTGTDTTDATIDTDAQDNGGAACGTITNTISMELTTNFMASAASWQGGDTFPFTETNFTETEDGQTGTHGTNDDGYHAGYSTGNSGPHTHTSDGSVTDECAFVSVEITDVEPSRRVMRIMKFREEKRIDKFPHVLLKYTGIKLASLLVASLSH